MRAACMCMREQQGQTEGMWVPLGRQVSDAGRHSTSHATLPRSTRHGRASYLPLLSHRPAGYVHHGLLLIVLRPARLTLCTAKEFGDSMTPMQALTAAAHMMNPASGVSTSQQQH